MYKLILIIVITAILTFQFIEFRRMREIAYDFHSYNVTLQSKNKLIEEQSRENSILANQCADSADKAMRIQAVVDAMAGKAARAKPTPKK